MGRCRRLVQVTALLVMAGCVRPDDAPRGAGWELKPPLPGASPVAAQGKLPGIYPAGSRIKDLKALGGFGPCDNYPIDLGERDWGAKGAVSIMAFPEEAAAYFEHRGFVLRVINRTAGAVPFAACDSALSIICEAKDADGEWREIEALPQTSCGNSFHRVFLGPKQYWEFPARQYDGKILTKLRFRLDPGGGQPIIYSNEFDGKVVAAQFKD